MGMNPVVSWTAQVHSCNPTRNSAWLVCPSHQRMAAMSMSTMTGNVIWSTGRTLCVNDVQYQKNWIRPSGIMTKIIRGCFFKCLKMIHRFACSNCSIPATRMQQTVPYFHSNKRSQTLFLYLQICVLKVCETIHCPKPRIEILRFATTSNIHPGWKLEKDQIKSLRAWVVFSPPNVFKKTNGSFWKVACVWTPSLIINGKGSIVWSEISILGRTNGIKRHQKKHEVGRQPREVSLKPPCVYNTYTCIYIYHMLVKDFMLELLEGLKGFECSQPCFKH